MGRSWISACAERCQVSPGAHRLTRQLLSAAQTYSQTPVAGRVPSKVRIQDNNFILQHDRNGGEAYVLMRNK
ncbi:hypothetical protein DLD99_14420 [Pseudomonas kribbensis]|uniref:Uncharacterized protein n=1 Tax=Pseudomonas kribbensis TaxID=1628086 RepID=A0A345RQQ1_9PSED|nr:hypothetical protein DLD99_14420 [Pseudomonas kribbensis]